ETWTAWEGFPVPGIRESAPAAVMGNVYEWRTKRPSAVWWCRVCVQRHRRPAVVPAEAAEAGADCRRPSGRRRAFASLLLRNGGAVARDRARARLCASHKFA